MEKHEKTETGEQENPRLRFAKREIQRVLDALERADGDEFGLAMRVLYLEDQVRDVNALATRWRQSYEAAAKILAQPDTEARAELLDEALRRWVGKA